MHYGTRWTINGQQRSASRGSLAACLRRTAASPFAGCWVAAQCALDYCRRSDEGLGASLMGQRRKGALGPRLATCRAGCNATKQMALRWTAPKARRLPSRPTCGSGAGAKAAAPGCGRGVEQGKATCCSAISFSSHCLGVYSCMGAAAAALAVVGAGVKAAKHACSAQALKRMGQTNWAHGTGRTDQCAIKRGGQYQKPRVQLSKGKGAVSKGRGGTGHGRMMGQGRDHNKSAGVHWNETIVRQEKEAKGGE